MQAAFRPPAPAPRVLPPNARPSPGAYMRYFKIMARNPLEIWTEGHFNELYHLDKIFGRNYAIIHDPKAIRHFLVTNEKNYRLTNIRRAVFEPVTGQGIFVAEGAKWKRTRQALTPVFTPRHVEGFGQAMIAHSRSAAKRLARSENEAVDISDEMTQLTLNILLACLFSGDEKIDAKRFASDLERLFEAAGMPHPFDLMEAPRWIPRIGRSAALRIVAGLRQQVASIALERKKLANTGAEPPQDFLTLLQRAGEDTGEPLSEDEVIDNLLTFLAAGHETTARSLAWTLYLLANSPDDLRRAEAEIDAATIDNAEPAKWGDELPFLTAVIKESMRLYPAAPILSRTAIGPDVLGDLSIDEGTEVVVSTWVLHRHRKLWRKPDIFDPARFLGDERKTIDRFTYLPFGAGPRVCIGASFAMQEMVIVMATLLRQLRFLPMGGEEPQPVMRITLQPSTPINLRVVAR